MGLDDFPREMEDFGSNDYPLNPVVSNPPIGPAHMPLIRLPAFLHGVPPAELTGVLADFPASLDHTIEAMPLMDETAQLRVKDLNGQVVTVQIVDHILRDTPEAQNWLRERRRASLLTLLEYTGHHPTEAKKLYNGEDEFDALIQASRQYRCRQNVKFTPGQTSSADQGRPPGLGDLGCPAPTPQQPHTRRRP